MQEICIIAYYWFVMYTCVIVKINTKLLNIIKKEHLNA